MYIIYKTEDVGKQLCGRLEGTKHRPIDFKFKVAVKDDLWDIGGIDVCVFRQLG
jgi:hypothetical protein